jgi:malate permease and related proteins
VASLDAFAKVLPILLLFGLGALLRRRGALRPGTLDDLRWLVLHVALPAALFLTFLRVSLEPRYAVIVVAVFVACLGVLAAGPALGRAVGVPSPMFRYLLTGFEAGMLGYAIYGAVFGASELYRFGIVDLGQVTFVFFVLAPLLVRHAGGRAPTIAQTVVTFARTPVILAIVGGMAGSAIGLGAFLDDSALGDAALRTLALLAALTTPLIALVIGASTSLSRGSLGAPARTIAVRMTLWVTLALVFDAIVIDRLLGLDRLFGAAVLTMAVLPPPFVIPLYLPGPTVVDTEALRDERYTMNTLSLATLSTLVAIVVVTAAYAA